MKLTHRKLPFPELVEGLSFLFVNIKYEVQPFDKLRERRQMQIVARWYK